MDEMFSLRESLNFDISKLSQAQLISLISWGALGIVFSKQYIVVIVYKCICVYTCTYVYL